MPSIPLIADPELIAELISQPNSERRFIILDVGKDSIYQQAHLPGAVHINYLQLQAGTPPAAGLPPATASLEALLSGVGLTPDTLVIAYDDEGGTRAARLLWLLDWLGHRHYCYVNGGIHAWLAADLPYSTEAHVGQLSQYRITQRNEQAIITLDELLACYQTPEVVVWDARSAEEYQGLRRSSAKAGHIPGAVNYEWSRALYGDNKRLRPLPELRQELHDLGITPDKTLVVHCQTHHRSSFAWLLARHLGYPQVRGYAGSWAEWGNHPDTPVSL